MGPFSRARTANAAQRAHGDMRQGGAAEWAGRCCVGLRGDRRTTSTMVHGDDARESPTVVGHGECGARGHAAELGRRLFRHGFWYDF